MRVFGNFALIVVLLAFSVFETEALFGFGKKAPAKQNAKAQEKVAPAPVSASTKPDVASTTKENKKPKEAKKKNKPTTTRKVKGTQSAASNCLSPLKRLQGVNDERKGKRRLRQQ